MVFFGRHGHKPAERELGQRFTVDVELETDLSAAGASDQLADTINYPDAYRIARHVVEGEPRDLLESVAEEIAARLLELERVQSATVRVWKRPTLEGEFDAFGVEVVRQRT
jgi:dihydroneopterin aldolase